MKTRILAEPGSTAEGRMDRYARLIDVAAAAGATALKNQWTSSPARMCLRRNAGPEYAASYEKIAYPLEWHEALSRLCHMRGLEYGCAVYLPEDIWMVTPYVDFLKIASFEALDKAMFVTALATGKPLIISTGMTSGELDLRGYANVKLLHCVSAYPCPREQAALGVLRNPARIYAGYSDHTRDVLTGALAVAAGAEVLEVHFRLDDTDPANLDYPTALAPEELAEYVRLVWQAEEMLGDGIKQPQPAEADMARYRVEKGAA